MTYSKEQLSKLSGGSKVRTTYKVPTLKFNGNTGLFTKFPVGDFKNGTAVPEVNDLIIMRARRTFSSFEKIPGGGSIRMFTNEHNTWQDPLTVFEAITGKKIKAVGSGLIEDLRAEFPSLRINSNLYCLFEGEVYKFVVKGKTRQSLVDLQKELGKDGTEFFEKKLKLTPKEEEGEGGNKYYFIKFEVTEASELETVGPFMESIGKIMDTMDEEYLENNKQIKEKAEAEATATPVGAEGVDDLDTIEVDDDGEEVEEDEIRVDDIPF